MPRYRLYNIKYDTDGEAIELPQELVVETEFPAEDYDDYDIEEFFADEISEQTGFCHFGFEFEEIVD